MGTRSLTRVYDEWNNRQIICMYRQFDGYPDGHGKELAEFLADFTMVNGIGMDQPTRIANGMGCLAAQIVKHFKEEAGGIYLLPPEIEDASQDYAYHVRLVRVNDMPIGLDLECCVVRFQWGAESDPFKGLPHDDKTLFKGSPADFLKWLDRGGEALTDEGVEEEVA